MRKLSNRNGVRLILSLLCLAAASACNEDPDCFNPYSSEVKIRFVDAANPTRDSVQITKSVRILGFENPYYEGADTAIFVLPVNLRADTTSYIFTVVEDSVEVVDTLTLSYSRSIRYISAECGVEQRIRGLQVVYDTFELLQVTDAELNINNPSNVQISK